MSSPLLAGSLCAKQVPKRVIATATSSQPNEIPRTTNGVQYVQFNDILPVNLLLPFQTAKMDSKAVNVRCCSQVGGQRPATEIRTGKNTVKASPRRIKGGKVQEPATCPLYNSSEGVCRLQVVFHYFSQPIFVFRFTRSKRRTGIQLLSPFEWLSSPFETEQLLILNWCSFRIARILKPPDMFDMELTSTKRQKQFIRLIYQFASHKILEGRAEIGCQHTKLKWCQILKALNHIQSDHQPHVLHIRNSLGRSISCGICQRHASNCTLPGTQMFSP